MKTAVHPLLAPTPGVSYFLTTLDFGPANSERKIYVQAALHADETPAMLVAHALRGKLQALEDAGKLTSKIVLVPMANPIGVGQFLLGNFIGRFETGSGRNYNRGFPFVSDKVISSIEGKLVDDAATNVRTIRQAWRQALEARAPADTFESLQQALMLLAHDADITLDLHCTREGPMHLYCGETIGDQFEPLVRYLRSPAQVLEGEAGGEPFDEAQNVSWQRIQEKFGNRYPIPHGNICATVEHRGQRDVTMEFADADAQAIVNFLMHTGDIAGVAPDMPPLITPATPLSGSEQFKAPTSGVLVYRAKVGAKIEVGQPLFDIVDPVAGTTVTLSSHTEGYLYMGRDTRWVRVGEALGRVSGSRAIRTGPLLSA